MSRTLVIAEPGGTHEGQFETMRRLIATAAACGADVIKPQWASSAERMCERRHAPDYLDDYRKLQFPLEWHGELSAYARSLGLQYACTVFLPGDAALVAPFVDYLKISSFEAADEVLYREAMLAKPQDKIKGRPVAAPVIVSTGMQDHQPREWRIWEDVCYVPMAVLHCCSSYPAPLLALNLSLCSGNGQYDGEPQFSGFSDHSRDVRVGAWAVCAGAAIIETHFRLDDCDPANKDYAVSFTPAEFKTYIANIRDAEAALGDGVKRVQPAEEPMLRFRVQA